MQLMSLEKLEFVNTINKFAQQNTHHQLQKQRWEFPESKGDLEA